jgi:quercetin dioxygenase-like cupin family protein
VRREPGRGHQRALNATIETFGRLDFAFNNAGIEYTIKPAAEVTQEEWDRIIDIDPLFQAPEPTRTACASVTFEPGARTAWHTHPLGQTLIVTAGCGLVQSWGGPVKVIRPGDVIWCPPAEKHWHGAMPTTAMTHLAIQEQLNGKVVDWMEKVSDEQYEALHEE